MLPPVSHPAPGWYTDPEQYGMERYWDGTAWTGQRRPVQAYAVPAVPVVAPMPVGAVSPVPTNGLATASLVCGIVGAVFSLIPWTFWLAWILGILAIVFGAIGRKRADRDPAVGKRSSATAGLILGVVAIVLGTVGLVLLATVLKHTVHTSNGFESCFDNPDQLHCD
jgi:glucose uptake protein GlcU